MKTGIDILENEIVQQYPDVLDILIRDHTTQKNKTRRQNVFGSRVVAEAGLPTLLHKDWRTWLWGAEQWYALKRLQRFWSFLCPCTFMQAQVRA